MPYPEDDLRIEKGKRNNNMSVEHVALFHAAPLWYVYDRVKKRARRACATFSTFYEFIEGGGLRAELPVS